VQAAGANVLAVNPNFKLATFAGAKNMHVPEKVGAVQPLSILKTTSPAYDLAPGTFFNANQAPVQSIPPHILQSAQQAAASIPGGANSPAGAAQLARSTKAITAALPGAATPGSQPLGPSIGHLAVAQQVLSHAVTNASQQAAAKQTAHTLANRLGALA
jgi:hypothetical protein